MNLFIELASITVAGFFTTRFGFIGGIFAFIFAEAVIRALTGNLISGSASSAPETAHSLNKNLKS